MLATVQGSRRRRLALGALLAVGGALAVLDPLGCVAGLLPELYAEAGRAGEIDQIGPEALAGNVCKPERRHDTQLRVVWQRPAAQFQIYPVSQSSFANAQGGGRKGDRTVAGGILDLDRELMRSV